MSDPDGLLPAERKVHERLGHLPLDFRAMGAVSNLFRASAAIRRHMESRVLADDRLSWTSFVALWVLWVWGEMESRDLAAAVGISRPTSTGVVTTLDTMKDEEGVTEQGIDKAKVLLEALKLAG